MDIYVNIGTLQDTPRKNEIIVGLLVMITILVEVHGVIYLLVVGRDVTYQYVEVGYAAGRRDTRIALVCGDKYNQSFRYSYDCRWETCNIPLYRATL